MGISGESIWNSVKNASLTWPALMVGAALACIAAMGIAGSSDTSSADGTVANTSVRAPDPDSLFDARSPGNRQYGWLVQSKAVRTGFADMPSDDSPTERVLTSVRQRPTAPFAPASDATPNLVVDQVDGPAEIREAGPADIGSGSAGTGGSTVGGGAIGGVLTNGGGGVSSGGGASTSPDTVVAPVTPAVLEPMTWVMLVLGFSYIGAMMRGRNHGFQPHGTR